MSITKEEKLLALREMRLSRKLSLQDVGERCGFHNSYISQLENLKYPDVNLETVNRVYNAILSFDEKPKEIKVEESVEEAVVVDENQHDLLDKIIAYMNVLKEDIKKKDESISQLTARVAELEIIESEFNQMIHALNFARQRAFASEGRAKFKMDTNGNLERME